MRKKRFSSYKSEIQWKKRDNPNTTKRLTKKWRTCKQRTKNRDDWSLTEESNMFFKWSRSLAKWFAGLLFLIVWDVIFNGGFTPNSQHLCFSTKQHAYKNQNILFNQNVNRAYNDNLFIPSKYLQNENNTFNSYYTSFELAHKSRRNFLPFKGRSCIGI